jgi:hypothetical protein
VRVLRSRATELEREFAFGVVRQLFEPALVEASGSERTELLEGAAGVAADLLGLAGSTAEDPPRASDVDPSSAILHRLYWLCANLAVAGPLCVVVDDAHWPDAPSLRYAAPVHHRPHRRGHLTSVFRKLRLDSRTDLANALAQEVPVSA